jgi:acyl transferase domain-containing protein/NAD(P)-dependent dehydrogenase (short-subunit alcohol dehydrogenase family)
VAASPEPIGCGIAVVGLACRFPGANTPDEFWENLVHGREARVELSDEQLRAAGVREELIRDPSYVKSAMPLAGVDQFDAGFFGFSPRDAAIMDPQHRHFLECCWEALENAGYDPERFDGSIGVFGGSGHNAYFHLNLLGNRALEEQVGHFLLRHTGNDKDFLATRVSYAMNLRGPSVNVQTACSTSLVAVHLAVSSLLSLECDIALAGGVTIEMPLGNGYVFRDGEILSPDGHCRPFDKSAQGTVFGSGVGLVVLRRLDDALAAGDTIHAVILGSAVNNDGAAKLSYLAPSVDGQAAAIREALVVADVDPATVSFIECHGTGTKLGDAIEIAALRQAYGSSVGGGECVLGSVKSNIGHLDTAAGVAGLIKVILAMRHRTIPGTLHFREPNEHVIAHAPPFVVRNDASRWEQPERMRAGVNSLGVGGTNAHVLLESPPAPARTAADRTVQLLPLSARSPAALRRRVDQLRDALADTTHALPDIAWTLQQGRHDFEHRAVIATAGIDEARTALDELRARSGDIGAKALPDVAGVSMLFAGGGAGYAGMGRDLYEAEPAYRKAIDRVCTIARDASLLDYDLRRLLIDAQSPEAARMERPTRGLPALFATQYACAQLWESVGIIPTAVIGHSVGEYAAACIAGVLSVDDALRIVVRRAQLFETLPQGSMLSVLATEDTIRALLPPAVTVAAVNAPGLTVVAGPVADVTELENMLLSRGIESQRVPIDVAAHSPMLQPILSEFRTALSRLRFRPPQVRIASNLTGEWLTAAQATDPGYWLRQLREPVRFAEGFALVAQEANVHLEVGPGTVLSSLVRQQPAFDEGHRAVSTMRHPREVANDRVRFHEAFGALWKAGVSVDWSFVHDAGARRRVPLPTYPFEHQRCWFDPVGAAEAVPSQAGTAPSAPEAWCAQEVWEPRPFTPRVPAGPHGIVLVSEGSSSLATSADTEVIRVDARDQAALRASLRSLREGTRWRVVSVVDSGDDAPASLERALLALKRQAETLIDVVPKLAGWCVLVRGAAPLSAPGGTTHVSPVAKAIVAAVRVLRTELDVDVRAIDCAPSLAGEPRLLAEILAGTDEVVALRGQERLTPVHRALPLPPFAVMPPNGLSGCVAITGGLGDLGLAIAEHLATSGWPRIALLARRSLPSGDVGHLGFHESSGSRSAARIRHVEALRARGADVRVFEVDVADAAALRATWSEVASTMGPVRVTLHTAGDLRDSLVGAKSDHDLQHVLAPKAAAHTLAQLTHEPLVLFSSTSAVSGLAGQFDYAAANAYMDAIAEQARADGQPVLSLGWGVFRDIGMAARLAAPPRPSTIPPGSITRRRRGDMYERVITASDWVAAEHRTKGGTTVLPGTALLALLVESLDDEHAVLADVSLLQPLVLDPSSRRVIQVLREGDRLTLRSALDADAAEREEWIADHVEARVAKAPEGGASRILRRTAIEARCRSSRTFQGRAVDHAQMAFGPRWACVDGVRYGEGEALIALSLDPSFWHDLGPWPLHPALLDMATGAAQELLPAVDLTRDFFVPQAYRAVRIHSPLTPIVVSHVRRTESTADHCEFDIIVADEAGHVLVAIDGFRLRRMPATVLDALNAGRAGRELPAGFVESLAHGIRADDAAPLLLRLVQQVGAGAVTISPVAIDELRRRRAPRTAATAGTDATAPRRREIGGDVIAPATAREQALARIWEEALGIDAVGTGDNFFELGGHSLLLTKVATRARKQLGISLPLARLFDVPTIAGWLNEPEASATPVADGWTKLARASREAFLAPDEPAASPKRSDIAV